MIDNFEQILNFLPKEPNEFLIYHVIIIKRKKDHPGLKCKNNSARTIKSYFIKDSNQLLDLKEEIIQIAEATKARVMINISPKDIVSAAWKVHDEAAAMLKGEASINKLHKIADSVVGRLTPKREYKLFLIDADSEDEYNSVMHRLGELGIEPVIKVPTKNGVHVMCKPFNTNLLKLGVDIHKNNPTLLYLPNSLDNV